MVEADFTMHKMSYVERCLDSAFYFCCQLVPHNFILSFFLSFIDQHHVLTYMEDAVNQLLSFKDDNPKVNPATFFRE